MKSFEAWRKELTDGDDDSSLATTTTVLPTLNTQQTTANTKDETEKKNEPKVTNTTPATSKDVFKENLQKFLTDIGLNPEIISKVVNIFVAQDVNQEVLMTTEKGLLKELLIKDLNLSVGIAAQILTAIENKKG